MAGVKSRLTQDEVKQLQHLLGSRQFSLLYKASVHGYNASIFHAKCDAQGPTVAVAYNGSGYIFGGFTCQSYVSSGGLKGKEGVLSPLKIPVKTASGAIYDYSSLGPNFGGGALQLLNQNAAAAAASSNNNYTYSVADLLGNDLGLIECEVYRVEGKLISKEKMFTEEIIEIRSYKPYLNSVPQIRILVLGPIGAGKSSFFNSVNSVFRGYVTSQAIAGSDNTSVTTQYRTYPVKDGRDGKPLPIIFCDTMGIEEKSGTGLEIDEVSNIIKGHVPDRYQVGFLQFYTPSLKDQIHCVAFVIDGCKIEILPEKLEEKLKQLRRKVNQFGMLYYGHCNGLWCWWRIEEFLITSVVLYSLVVQCKLGIPLAQIVPVKNYCSELDLLCDVDILLLSAVRQLIRLAESYLDNFPFEKAKKEP
uniref:TLDc domain-containing protein n=1 Tax=Terrapene triunguis TaxID=2587831 RepID=A0A674JCC1_9SAUR